VGVYSLTLSYTPGSMKCDSSASFLACTFASLCFSHEPKARVTTFPLKPMVLTMVSTTGTHYPYGSFIKEIVTMPNLLYWDKFECFGKPFRLMVKNGMLI
jgi:hypothetical protein